MGVRVGCLLEGGDGGGAGWKPDGIEMKSAGEGAAIGFGGGLDAEAAEAAAERSAEIKKAEMEARRRAHLHPGRMDEIHAATQPARAARSRSAWAASTSGFSISVAGGFMGTPSWRGMTWTWR